MPSHMGFAHCLREGLKTLSTEYVMVMQHDRAFSENIDIHPILNLMDREKSIKYIGFQTAANKQYVYKKLKSKYRMKSNEEDLIEEITNATGWCIKSIDYHYLPKFHQSI